jgi:hypothetical protein
MGLLYTAPMLILGRSTKPVKVDGCVYFVEGKEGVLKYLIGVIRAKKFFKYSERIRVPLCYQMLYDVCTENLSI